MLRRVLTMLLIIPLLGSQLPALPHTHADTGMAEPEDHASRPHVHMHRQVGHHHHHGSSHQHHYPASTEPTVDDLDNAASVALSATQDHDYDAVYLPNALTFGMNRKSVETESPQHVVALRTLECSTPTSEDTLASSLSPHPPPGGVFRLPLYLRTLSLRI